MGFINIPSELTEEEQNLLESKYQKLRDTKEALQALKGPEKPSLKRSTKDPIDAREAACKLIRSGAIAAIQKQEIKQDQALFKRPKNLERMVTVSSTKDDDVPQQQEELLKSEKIKEKSRRKRRYQRFVFERKQEKELESLSSCNDDYA